MALVPYITDADIAADTTRSDVATAIRARRKNGQLLNLDRMLLQSPPVALGWNAYMGAIRTQMQLSPLLRELAICAVAVLNRADYEWTQHVPEFLAAGGTEAQLDALKELDVRGQNVAAFSTLERLTLTLTIEMTRDINLSVATKEGLRAQLPVREIAVLVSVIASYNMVSRYLVALGIEPE